MKRLPIILTSIILFVCIIVSVVISIRFSSNNSTALEDFNPFPESVPEVDIVSPLVTDNVTDETVREELTAQAWTAIHEAGWTEELLSTYSVPSNANWSIRNTRGYTIMSYPYFTEILNKQEEEDSYDASKITHGIIFNSYITDDQVLLLSTIVSELPEFDHKYICTFSTNDSIDLLDIETNIEYLYSWDYIQSILEEGGIGDF